MGEGGREEDREGGRRWEGWGMGEGGRELKEGEYLLGEEDRDGGSVGGLRGREGKKVG